MNISCKIVEDLLPLYLDDSCSEDSRAALEEHLKGCPSCRAELSRMRSGLTNDIRVEKSVPNLEGYVKKVKNHRIRVAAVVVLITIITSAVLALGCLALQDMYRQANPIPIEVEAGTYSLTANDLKTTAEEIGQYAFYTNHTQIQVTVQGEDSFQGTIMLWNAADNSSFIQIHDVSEKAAGCVFTGLSSANRYRITCDNLNGAVITVGEGRTVNFWNSLISVLNDIVGAIF